MTAKAIKLICSKCGAKGRGSCRCGAAYLPPDKRAAKALKTKSGWSNRAIAEKIGVTHKTVGRARQKAGGDKSPPEKRQGKDGKSYPARPKPKTKAPPSLKEQIAATFKTICNSADHCASAVRAILKANRKLDYEALHSLGSACGRSKQIFTDLCTEIVVRMDREDGKKNRQTRTAANGHAKGRQDARAVV
jgi:IS30 family transposase